MGRTNEEDKKFKTSSSLHRNSQETTPKPVSEILKNGLEILKEETSRPNNKEEDDLPSQEEIKTEVNNHTPLVSTTPLHPNPIILLNHQLKENLDPGLVTTSMKSRPSTKKEDDLTSQEGTKPEDNKNSPLVLTTPPSTLMNRYLKENLNPGLTMTPLTPLMAPIPPSPLIETQKHSSTSHIFSSNKEIPHQGLVTKPPVIMIITPRAPTTELKSRGTLKRMKNDSNTKSNPGVKHHTSVNKQTGSAHNLPQDTRPISRTGSVRRLYSRTTMGQGRPPETQEFSFPFVQKETGRGGSRSQG